MKPLYFPSKTCFSNSYSRLNDNSFIIPIRLGQKTSSSYETSVSLMLIPGNPIYSTLNKIYRVIQVISTEKAVKGSTIATG